jgi:hypothetical protein
MKDKVKELLGTGLPNNVVATATGISESQITQWMSEEEFAGEVQTLRTMNLAKATERDNKYNSLEDSILEIMEEKLTNYGLTWKPGELARILAIVNGAKRRGAPTEVSGQVARSVVPLQLPPVIVAAFVVNGHNQVVEVEGRTVATISASKVVRELENRSKGRTLNVIEDKRDMEKAHQTLDNIRKVLALPVADVLSPLAQQL